LAAVVSGQLGQAPSPSPRTRGEGRGEGAAATRKTPRAQVAAPALRGQAPLPDPLPEYGERE
jgi:hypothetical protein